MSYSPNIPQISDFLAISQKQMIANFQAINASFFTDHVGLTAVDNVGQHNVLTLRPQTTDPTTGTDQCALYNKLVLAVPQLFFRSNNNATPVQMSNSNLNTVQTGASVDAQSSFIAGPFTVYVGYIANCPANQLVTLIPSSNLIYVGLSTIKTNEGSGSQGTYISTPINITGNQFNITHNAVALINPTVYYMAIGQ